MTGLRPGEKLYEELLIDARRAYSPSIDFRAQEYSLPPDELWPKIKALEDTIQSNDVSRSLIGLAELVPEWKRG